MRPVPPTVIYRLRGKYERDLPPQPTMPQIELRSVAGHVERVSAPPDSPEYQRWLEEMERWEMECKRLRDLHAQQILEFCYDYACVAWRREGEEEWQNEPPAGWDVDQVYRRHGLETTGNRRLEFILHEVLSTPEMMEAVQRAMFPVGEADMSPVSPQEVEEAQAFFRAGGKDTARLGETGRHRAGTTQRAHKHAVPGVSDGAGVGSLRRRLVSLFTHGKSHDDGV